MKILEVIWEDSFHNSGPIAADEVDEEPMLMHLIGYFVKETDKLLVLAGEYIESDDRWRYINAIDKKAIKSRKVIRK